MVKKVRKGDQAKGYRRLTHNLSRDTYLSYTDPAFPFLVRFTSLSLLGTAPLITSITTPKGLGNRKVKGASDQLSNLI